MLMKKTIVFVSSVSQNVFAELLAKRMKGSNADLKDITFTSSVIEPGSKPLYVKEINAALTHYAKIEGTCPHSKALLFDNALMENALAVCPLDKRAHELVQERFFGLYEKKGIILTNLIVYDKQIINPMVAMQSLYDKTKLLLEEYWEPITEAAFILS